MCCLLQTVEEEVPVDDDDAAEEDAEEEISDDDEEGKVEEEEDEKPKTKKVEKTVWDWVLVNDNKPIWTRKYVPTFHVSRIHRLNIYEFQGKGCMFFTFE